MKLAALLSAAWVSVAAMPISAEVIERQQIVRPLPGALDSVLMVNDNNPELIRRHPDFNISRWGCSVRSRCAEQVKAAVQHNGNGRCIPIWKC